MQRIKRAYKLSEAFNEEIYHFSFGYLPPDKIESALNIFQTEVDKHFFTLESEANLLRIFGSMFDKASIIGDCIKYPHYAEILVTIASNSNYLTDILVRNPEYFYSIVNHSDLKIKLDEDFFIKKLRTRTKSLKSFSSKLHALRTIRRNEILKIGVKDILGLDKLEEVTGQLSVLAKNIASHLFELCFDEVIQKRGLDVINDNYCVLSLGKLGGRELNFSSDIDLIIFYEHNFNISKSKTFEEFLTEVTHLFIESVSSHSADGFLYRIDFRLRPDGKNSPLCRSFGEYLNYYESKGEDWERQMLIKADFLCGNEELYFQFTNYLSAFIYPASFLTSPTEQIKKLKRNIEKNLSDDENIKLFSGGIRDIEFSVQALQLLNGGKSKNIRTGNTLKAISALQKENLLSDNEADTLVSSYKLYRKIEHFLQLMNDKQTHTIPAEGELLDKLIHFLKYDSRNKFRRVLTQKRNAVQSVYNSIVGLDNREHPENIISGIKFGNKINSRNDLNYLREGKGLFGQKQFDKDTIEAFNKIEKYLMEYLSSALQPDEVLNNFVRIIRSSVFPSIWYKAFYDKKLFASFLKICEFSQKSVDILSDNEELQEFFLTKKVFETLTKRSLSSLSINQLIFILSVRFALNKITDEKISNFLAHFYKLKISGIANLIVKPELAEQNFFIAALGSVGTSEATFHSDIDLLIITNGSESRVNSEPLFQKYLLKLREDLFPIEVDCRLKPEGKNSPLAWNIDQYSKYLNERVRVWELQAMTKVHFVYGSKRLFGRFLTLIENRIRKESENSLKKEIPEMRRKIFMSGIDVSGKSTNIKKSTGGLVDIEFVIQFLILCHPILYKTTRGKSLVKVISGFDSSIISDQDKNEMIVRYRFLKRLIAVYQNLFNTKNYLVNSEQKKNELLAYLMGFDSTTKYIAHLDSVMKQNNKIFEKYLLRG